MVRIYPARNHSTIYLIKDIQSSSGTSSLIRVLHQEEKILSLYGITEDPMEPALDQAVETNPSTRNKREVTCSS